MRQTGVYVSTDVDSTAVVVVVVVAVVVNKTNALVRKRRPFIVPRGADVVVLQL